jgi:hypothetical protein
MTLAEFRTLDDKIDAIMAMAGVSPRDFDACRPNYQNLGEPEIDRRLKRLVAARSRIAGWRAGWKALELDDPATLSVNSAPNHPVKVQNGAAALEPDEALQAYARVENAISHLHPHAIVGLNKEGRILVDSFMKDLDFSPLVVSVDSGPDGELTWNHLTLFGRQPAVHEQDTIVALVGHYLNSGETMAAVAAEAKRIFRTERVICTVLAASEPGVRTVSRNNLLIYHHLIKEIGEVNRTSRSKDLIPLSDINGFSQKLKPHIDGQRQNITAMRQFIEAEFPDRPVYVVAT